MRSRYLVVLSGLGCFFTGALWFTSLPEYVPVYSYRQRNIDAALGFPPMVHKSEDKTKTTDGALRNLEVLETSDYYGVDDKRRNNVTESGRESESTKRDSDKVLILMWSNYYERHGDDLMNNMILSGRRWDSECCSGPEVEITLNRSLVEKADAIVIFAYFKNLDIKDLPPTRRPEQIWILFAKESPRHTPSLTRFNSLFNWTMSYRHDSDIWAPYGSILNLPEVISEANITMGEGVSLDAWIKGKSKLLTGVISHCSTKSRREKLAEALINVSIPVDIYGSCGFHICQRLSKSCNHTAFWSRLGKHYKFYFAAENSLCVDYITEKFWRTLELGMVPVVYGGGNYLKEAPPHSFIDTRDFSSPKELANFLQKLDKDEESYKKYFLWRAKYKIKIDESWAGFCTLCKKMKDFKKSWSRGNHTSTFHSQLHHWWNHIPTGGNTNAPKNHTAACFKTWFSF